MQSFVQEHTANKRLDQDPDLILSASKGWVLYIQPRCFIKQVFFDKVERVRVNCSMPRGIANPQKCITSAAENRTS